jgi:hypothetical protein
MGAATHNIVIEQGATFELTATWTDEGSPVDLTDVLARMQIRNRYSSPDAYVSVDSDTLGGIAVDALTGVVSVEIPAVQTAALPGRLRGVYDLELLFPSGRVVRLLKGRVRVDPEVTKI